MVYTTGSGASSRRLDPDLRPKTCMLPSRSLQRHRRDMSWAPSWLLERMATSLPDWSGFSALGADPRRAQPIACTKVDFVPSQPHARLSRILRDRDKERRDRPC